MNEKAKASKPRDGKAGHIEHAMTEARLIGERMIALNGGHGEAGNVLAGLALSYAEQAVRRMQDLGKRNIELATAAFTAATQAPTLVDAMSAQRDLAHAMNESLVSEMARTRVAAAHFSADVLDAIGRHYAAMAEAAKPDEPPS